MAQLLDRDAYTPVTLLLPTDGTMAALPKEQRDFLLHQDQLPQLVEYLKYHVLPGQKVGPAVLLDATGGVGGGAGSALHCIASSDITPSVPPIWTSKEVFHFLKRCQSSRAGDWPGDGQARPSPTIPSLTSSPPPPGVC